MEIILFCNPFARQLFTMLREEREKACDDAVLEQGGEKMAYLTALGWCARNTHSVQAALGVSGKDSQMLARMKRIANQPISGIRLSPLLLFAAIATLFCGLFYTNNSKQASINRIPFAATQIKSKGQLSSASSIAYATPPQTQGVRLTIKAQALSKNVLPTVSLSEAEQPIPNSSPEIISIPSFNQLNKLAIISVVNTPNNFKGIINTLKQRFQTFTEVERKQLLSHVFSQLSREEKQEILDKLQYGYLEENNPAFNRDSIPSGLSDSQVDSYLPVISPILRVKLLSLLWDEVNRTPFTDAIQLLQPIIDDSSRVIIEQPFIPIP
jgi:hypothetical protein